MDFVIPTQKCGLKPESVNLHKSLCTLLLIPCNSYMLLPNPHSFHGQLETDSLGNLKIFLEKESLLFIAMS